ncbi:MAG: hypothetical protein Q9217_006451 [Psora testacea]
MGGIYATVEAANPKDQKVLSWLQLNESFPVDGLIKDDFLHTTSSSATQYVGGGAFWTDVNQTMLYSMAGFPENTTSGQPNINTYTIEYDNWQSIRVSGGPFNKLNRVQGMYASSFDGGGSKSFIAGGKNWLPGLIMFESTDPLHPSWRNFTDNVPYFWGPTTQYVRFGKQGVLISIGGFTSFNDNSHKQRDMSAIQVYDIDSQQWSQVFATGDIPKPRSEFCSVLSAAPDDSSFQMTIYGGWSQTDNYALEDVYVLTMPAFYWIKVNSSGNAEDELATHAGRARHHCHAYKDRQMIVLGGEVLNGSKAFNMSSCNESYPVIKLLDTTTFQWHTKFPLADSIYQVPQPVYQIIGGGPNGSAQPASKWQKGSNLDLFSSVIPRYNPSNNSIKASTDSNTGGKTSTTIEAPNSATSNNAAGAIAGSVVGGVAGLAIIGTLVYFFHFRRRRRNQSQIPEWQKPELSGELPPPLWASSRPDFRTHEVQGDHEAKQLRANEMSGDVEIRELNGWNAVEAPPSEMAHELPGGLGRR